MATSFSFEFFPPKTDEGERTLWSAIRRVEALRPAFVSVTYGAGGSTRDRTVRVTEQIAADTTLVPVAHLTCVGSSRDELRRVVADYAAAGVGRMLALRGDPPAGPGSPWVPHPEGLDHAIDLVRLIRGLGTFEVGVAAFPDRHPESPDLDWDARILAEKQDAGASFAITQFLFEPGGYSGLVERAARHGCTMPVIPGLMPVTDVGQITRFAALSGAAFPPALAARFDAVRDDPAAVQELGVEVTVDLARDLIERGAPGLHLYTLNRSTSSVEVVEALGISARGG